MTLSRFRILQKRRHLITDAQSDLRLCWSHIQNLMHWLLLKYSSLYDKVCTILSVLNERYTLPHFATLIPDLGVIHVFVACALKTYYTIPLRLSDTSYYSTE